MSRLGYVILCVFLARCWSFLKVLIPHGARDSVQAMQCVASMDRRRCLIRRAGAMSGIEDVTGFHVGGVYCSSKLRGSGIATSMMLRLLGPPTSAKDARHCLPFAKVYDSYDEYLSQVSGPFSFRRAHY